MLLVTFTFMLQLGYMCCSFQFQKASEHVLFSCSVTDVFTQLNQCLAVIKQLECPVEELATCYMHHFSQTVEKVLLAYADLLMYTDKQSVVGADIICLVAIYDNDNDNDNIYFR